MKDNQLDKIIKIITQKIPFLKKIEKIMKYFFFSVIATIADIIALFILTEFFKIYYLLSAALSYLIGLFIAFFGNKKYTFNKNNSKKNFHKFIDFFVISLIDICLTIILIKTLTEIVGLWYILSKIIVVIIIFFFKYLAHKKIAFRD